MRHRYKMSFLCDAPSRFQGKGSIQSCNKSNSQIQFLNCLVTGISPWSHINTTIEYFLGGERGPVEKLRHDEHDDSARDDF